MNEVEKIGEDVLHVIEAPVTFLEKTGKVLDSAIKDDASLKVILTTLVTKAEGIASSVVPAATADGTNLPEDAAAVASVEDFFSYVKNTVVPEIEALYGQVKADVA